MKRLILWVTFTAVAFAQANTPALQSQIAQDFEKLKSGDWKQRQAAFDDLTSIGCPSCSHSKQPIIDGTQNAINSHAVTHDEMSGHLIDLLTKEAEFHKQIEADFDKSGGQTGAPDGYYDYLGDLVMTVVYLRDPRSLPTLLYFIDSGNMATSAIASFGDPALTQTLALIDSPNQNTGSYPHDPVSLRQSAFHVLSDMVDAKNLQKFSDPPTARAKIKDRLMTAAASEPSAHVRMAAIEGLGKLGDPDTVALLQNIVAADSTPDPQGRPGRNLVRESAQRALSKKP